MNSTERYKFLSRKISETQCLILSLNSAIQFLQNHQDENSKSMILFYRKSIDSEIENLEYLQKEFEIVKAIGVKPEGENGKERYINAMQLKDEFQRDKFAEFRERWLNGEIELPKGVCPEHYLPPVKREERGDKYIEHFIGGGLL